MRTRLPSSLLFLPFLMVSGVAQTATSQQPAEAHPLTIAVSDENNVPVAAARVLLESQGVTRRCETDVVGRCQYRNVSESAWRLTVEKEGFYIFALPAVQKSGILEITLTHQHEVRETVNVIESSPAIDPSQVSSQEQLSGIDITNIPYPNTRDYRYALNFIPGIVLDQKAQPHLAGSETYQMLTLLDGFEVTQPASGELLVRVSTDALRSVSAETSRLPAQYGKGPAGVLSLQTGIGDDHYRFAATNFFPSFQNKKGWALDKVDPRFTLSGPIKKGRIWFFDGLDGEYDNVVVPDLPRGEDADTVWRFGNLAKVQANLTRSDIVTTSFLVNRLHDDHFKLSTLAPATTTPEDSENAYVATIKEQHSFSAEKLLEAGLAFNQYGFEQAPLGGIPYVLTPNGAQGNYYLHAQTLADRWQALVRFYIPRDWHGRNDFVFGADIDRLAYHQQFSRSPISSLRSDGSLALHSTFFGGGPTAIYNTEVSAYAQDRWFLTSRLLIEPGIRFDWDEIVRRPLLSPRLAGTYVLDEAGNTKISAGVGIVYESTNLSLIAAPLAGSRSDTFYDPAANPTSTFLTSFAANLNALRAPRFVNWSVALERRLPAQIFLKAEFLQRNGSDGFVYNTLGNVNSTSFFLQNTRRDRYRAFKIDLRRTFRKSYVITASYTRSSSRSNQVLDYSLDNLTISPQVAGPYPWDAPNRFISWGWLPLIKGFDVGYSCEAHTGFPFTVINSQQQLVQPPGVHRFPEYFALNLHLEKRFHSLGFYWALRGGFDNITNRQNAFVVNNVTGSPNFLTFSGFDRRAFTARIRFLGRK